MVRYRIEQGRRPPHNNLRLSLILLDRHICTDGAESTLKPFGGFVSYIVNTSILTEMLRWHLDQLFKFILNLNSYRPRATTQKQGPLRETSGTET